MKQDRERWNAKFDDQRDMGEASQWVRNMHKMAPGPKVLDLAAGQGRNAAFLARQGYKVLALDLSDRAVHHSYQEVVSRDGKGDGQNRVVARLAAQKGWTGDVPLVRNLNQSGMAGCL